MSVEVQTLCILCGGDIGDAKVLVARGLNPPKLCEICRHKVRDYRTQATVEHMLEEALIVRLDASFIGALRKETRERTKGGEGDIYSLGGDRFGPQGGAAHDGKTLFHVYCDLEEGKEVLLRNMTKRDTLSGHSWTYFVLENAPDGSHQNEVASLCFQFTSVYKSTLKGFGRQFRNSFPIEGDHRVLLNGSSSARSGRYGNAWAMFVRRD